VVSIDVHSARSAHGDGREGGVDTLVNVVEYIKYDRGDDSRVRTQPRVDRGDCDPRGLSLRISVEACTDAWKREGSEPAGGSNVEAVGIAIGEVPLVLGRRRAIHDRSRHVHNVRRREMVPAGYNRRRSELDDVDHALGALDPKAWPGRAMNHVVEAAVRRAKAPETSAVRRVDDGVESAEARNVTAADNDISRSDGPPGRRGLAHRRRRAGLRPIDAVHLVEHVVGPRAGGLDQRVAERLARRLAAHDQPQACAQPGRRVVAVVHCWSLFYLVHRFQKHMGAACAKNGQDFHASENAQAMIPVMLDGQPTLMPSDVRVGRLLNRLPRSRRPLVSLEMGDARLNPDRTLWQEGVREGAQLHVVREPLAAARCMHVGLQVGLLCDQGYTLVCPDCEQSAVVQLNLERGGAVEPADRLPAAKEMERRWMADRSADAMRDCHHPMYAWRLVLYRGENYKWTGEMECRKCRADANETVRAVDDLTRAWRAAHMNQPVQEQPRDTASGGRQ